MLYIESETHTEEQHKYQNLPVGELQWVVGSTPLCSINRPRRTDTKRSCSFGCRCYGNRLVRWTVDLLELGYIGLYRASW